MKIGIIGAGALGGVIGGFLHSVGEDVQFYELNTDIVEAIRSNGLRIDRPHDSELMVQPPITTNPGEIGLMDVIFVFTKAFHTDDALSNAEPMIGEETRVATLQNGVLNMDIIAEHVPMKRVLGGYAVTSANTISPGHVKFMGASEGVIGGADIGTAEQLANSLTRGGIPTKAVRDPEPYIWQKQIRVNVPTKPLAALTELRNGPQLEYEETRDVARHLIEEAMEVARAKGIEILDDDPVSLFLEPLPPEKYHKKSSILEDVENHRRTEIDHINGAVVKYAEEEGIDVPYNRMATQLVKAKERGYLEYDPQEDEE